MESNASVEGVMEILTFLGIVFFMIIFSMVRSMLLMVKVRKDFMRIDKEIQEQLRRTR